MSLTLPAQQPRKQIPPATGIPKVNLHFCSNRELLVFSHLQPAVPGQRASQNRRKFTDMLTQGSNDNSRFFARHLDQHGKAGMTLYQGRNVAILGPAQQIPFPMTRNRSVFCLGGSFPDRDGIDDLTSRLSMFTGMARTAHAPLRPQMVHQLFFQYSPRLNEQAAVGGLEGRSQALVIGIVHL